MHNCDYVLCNVRGLSGNLSDLTVASSQNDILWCSVTFQVLDMRHVSELLGPGFGRPLLIVVPGQDASGLRDGCIRAKCIWIISPTKI